MSTAPTDPAPGDGSGSTPADAAGMSSSDTAGSTASETAGSSATDTSGGPGDERQAAWEQAVVLLTRAARQRTQIPDPAGGTDRDGGPIDFADFLAGVLAAVAANIGGSWRLTAGRPGSWEADLVHRLIAGTVGHDDEYLWEHRTEPVVVPLHVLDLVYAVDDFPSVDRALGELDDRYDAVPEAEYDVDAYEADLARTMDAYAATYQAYAAAFTTAVAQAAAELPGLRVPVRVIAVHDPRDLSTATIDGQPAPDGAPVGLANPDPYDEDDPLAARLWQDAFDTVPIPPVPLMPTLPAVPPGTS
jgi:hypothetical protein